MSFTWHAGPSDPPTSCLSLAPCCSLADEFSSGRPYLPSRQPLLYLHLASLAMFYFFLQRLTIRPDDVRPTAVLLHCGYL